MIDITATLQRDKGQVYEHFPQVYRAKDIQEFLDNKKVVKPTDKLLPYGLYYNGFAIIVFDETFYESVSVDRGKLVDKSSELVVRLDTELGKHIALPELFSKNLTNGKLFGVQVCYDTFSGMSWLTRYEEINKAV